MINCCRRRRADCGSTHPSISTPVAATSGGTNQLRRVDKIIIERHRARSTRTASATTSSAPSRTKILSKRLSGSTLCTRPGSRSSPESGWGAVNHVAPLHRVRSPPAACPTIGAPHREHTRAVTATSAAHSRHLICTHPTADAECDTTHGKSCHGSSRQAHRTGPRHHRDRPPSPTHSNGGKAHQVPFAPGAQSSLDLVSNTSELRRSCALTRVGAFTRSG